MKTAGEKIKDQTEQQCDIEESLSFPIKAGCSASQLNLF